MVKLMFAALKEGVVIPSKRKEDAGYDVYACLEGKSVIIPAHTTVNIPTGIASVIPEGYYIGFEERGSTGSKGIKKSAGVIDSGYRDEWFVSLTNSTDKPLVIKAKDDNNSDDHYRFLGATVYPETKAIVQAILHEVIDSEAVTITPEELKEYKSKRMFGKLGSSGK